MLDKSTLLRRYRSWRQPRAERRAEHYAQISEDQKRALERYHDRDAPGAPSQVPPHMRQGR